jgi:hypothetical protein
VTDREKRFWVGFRELWGGTVNGENRERWRELCELAEKEQDPRKLVELTEEINRLLEEKERRLREGPKS